MSGARDLSKALLGLAEGVRRGKVKPTSEEVAALFLLAGQSLGEVTDWTVRERGLLRLEIRTQRLARLVDLEAPEVLIERELSLIEQSVAELRVTYPHPLPGLHLVDDDEGADV